MIDDWDPDEKLRLVNVTFFEIFYKKFCSSPWGKEIFPWGLQKETKYLPWKKNVRKKKIKNSDFFSPWGETKNLLFVWGR